MMHPLENRCLCDSDEFSMPLDNRGNPGLSSGPPRYPGTFLLALREALANLSWETRRWLGDAVVCVDAEGEEHIVGKRIRQILEKS